MLFLRYEITILYLHKLAINLKNIFYFLFIFNNNFCFYFFLGVTLSREEDDCIWVYNRSENPIFVNSLALEDPNSPSPTRVPAEYCLCVYDPAKAAQQHFEWQNIYPHMGPIDPKSIRISFAKGWGGQRYSRKEITACPCWLEILLAPCR